MSCSNVCMSINFNVIAAMKELCFLIHIIVELLSIALHQLNATLYFLAQLLSY